MIQLTIVLLMTYYAFKAAYAGFYGIASFIMFVAFFVSMYFVVSDWRYVGMLAKGERYVAKIVDYDDDLKCKINGQYTLVIVVEIWINSEMQRQRLKTGVFGESKYPLDTYCYAVRYKGKWYVDKSQGCFLLDEC